MSDYNEGLWTLDDLFKSRDDAAALLDKLSDAAMRIETLRDTLVPGIHEQEFENILALIEDFARKAHAVHAYAALRFSEDTQDTAALAFMGEVDQAVTTARNRIVFFELWWRALDSDNASRLLEGSGDLRYYLEQERLFTDHTLSEPEEKLVSIKDVNGINALVTVYDMITNKYEFTLEADGEEHKLSRDVLMSYVRHPEAKVREAAYREQFRVYANESTVLGQIYVNRVRDWSAEQMELRHFASPIAVRNLENNIPDEVTATLLDVCASEASVFQEYFKLKADELGVDKLSRFDLYAPVSKDKKEPIAYDTAVRTVLDAFERFSPDAAEMAGRVVKQGHLDSSVRSGKRGGAFCYGVLPELTPWVLVNYTGEPRDVATLAHELGHAIHSMAASEHSILTAHSCLPLAETASVFSEMLLTDHLLEQEQDEELKRVTLIETVDSIYATVMRQAFFVMFEQAAHNLAVEGRTVEELSDLYYQNLTAQFGDSVEIDDVFRHEWISIPHIYHVPFYCYAYSFGMLLSLALYARYRKEGDAFVPVFMKILTHGGSLSPQDILTEAGVDMTDPEFWRGGFRVIEDMIRRIKGE